MAKAASSSGATSILTVFRLLWTKSYWSKIAWNYCRHRSLLNLPNTKRQWTGSWSPGVGGHGQTMSGWMKSRNKPGFLLFKPSVSRSINAWICFVTISDIAIVRFAKENTISEFRQEPLRPRGRKTRTRVWRGRTANSADKEQSQEEICSTARATRAKNRSRNKSASPTPLSSFDCSSNRRR